MTDTNNAPVLNQPAGQAIGGAAFLCSECNHRDDEHREQAAPKTANCSFGWCPCSQLRAAVRETGTVTEPLNRPGFDHATGKWASR